MLQQVRMTLDWGQRVLSQVHYLALREMLSIFSGLKEVPKKFQRLI
jgi:hypothetical protein